MRVDRPTGSPYVRQGNPPAGIIKKKADTSILQSGPRNNTLPQQPSPSFSAVVNGIVGALAVISKGVKKLFGNGQAEHDAKQERLKEATIVENQSVKALAEIEKYIPVIGGSEQAAREQKKRNGTGDPTTGINIDIRA